MNRIATVLLTASALCLGGSGIWLMIFWLSRPLGPQFGAGEMFGTLVGLVIVGAGIGLGWGARAIWHDQRSGWVIAALWATAATFGAYVALSTPGPAPIPVPLSIGAAVTGVVIGTLVLARATGLPARWWNA